MAWFHCRVRASTFLLAECVQSTMLRHFNTVQLQLETFVLLPSSAFLLSRALVKNFLS